MIFSKKSFLVVFVVALIVAGLTVSTPAQNPPDEPNYRKQGVEYDHFGRIVTDPQSGKVNYLWDKPDIDMTTKGNAKAQSVPFSAFPERTPISDTKPLDTALPDGAGYLPFEEEWIFGIFGSGIGKSGITTADIDNDGEVEIVMGGSTSTFGSNDFWYVLEYSAVSQAYRMQWISDVLSAGISSIAAFDIDNDGVYTIFIGLSNGDVHIFNGSTLEEIGIINSPGNQINRILYADADNDAIEEVVLCDSAAVFIYNATSFALEHQIPYGASDCEVGNVDADASNEIVLANGLVLEFNGVSTTVEWDYPGGDFGYLVELSDIDSDGMEEVIGASTWHYITTFDIDVQSPKWQIPTDLDVDALIVTDVDNDGIDDVLYGDGQWGEIHCYDAITVTEKWLIDNPDHGVTNIAVFDTDGDGDLEILWGAGVSSTGADHLYVHSIPTLLLEWQSQHVDGPFHALDVGDVDSDGQQEIVFASFSSNSGYKAGIIFIYDAATYELEWQSPTDIFDGYTSVNIYELKIGDVDDDGEQEIVVATARSYDGAIYIINGITHVLENSYLYDNGAPIYSLAIADVDNDDQTEIIAGGSRVTTGSPGVYVYIIDGSTGTVEWKSISLGDYWSEMYTLEVSDVDDDGVLEIVAINDSVFIIDGISHQQWQSTLSGCYGLDLADIDDDDIDEVIVGTSGGSIIAIDGQSHAEEFNATVSASSIVGLRAYNIDQQGRVEIIFSSAGQINTYSIDDSLLLWQSEVLGSSAGDYNAIFVSNIDQDAFSEIAIGSSYRVIVFEGPQSLVSNYTILHRDGAIWSSDTGWEMGTPPYYPGSDYARDLEFSGSTYHILHRDGAICDSTPAWNLRTPPYYPGSDYAVNLEITESGEQVVLHRDGAIWYSDTGWELSTPPYYPGSDYARALELRADASYVVLHKEGAVYDSASGWVMSTPPYYASSAWVVDMKLETGGYVLLHKDGALWSTAEGWVLTTPPYYASSDYARALELVGSRYIILHKHGAIYDSFDNWIITTPPYYPGNEYARDLEMQ